MLSRLRGQIGQFSDRLVIRWMQRSEWMSLLHLHSAAHSSTLVGTGKSEVIVGVYMIVLGGSP